jgi:hypothetical protein
MIAPTWQYHELDHPGEDFDALAEIYDQNMKNIEMFRERSRRFWIS